MEGGEGQGTHSTSIADFNTLNYRPKKHLAIHLLSPTCIQSGHQGNLPSLFCYASSIARAAQADTFLTTAQQTASAFRPTKNNDPSSESHHAAPFIIRDSCFHGVTLGIQLTRPADWISTILKPLAFPSRFERLQASNGAFSFYFCFFFLITTQEMSLYKNL